MEKKFSPTFDLKFENFAYKVTNAAYFSNKHQIFHSFTTQNTIFLDFLINSSLILAKSELIFPPPPPAPE